MPRPKTCATVLILCFLLSSCLSSTANKGTLRPIPTAPETLPVVFEQAEGGLFLSDDDYRNLEKNIERQRSYATELRNQINYYRSILGDNK